jgi:hypothetical protein
MLQLNDFLFVEEAKLCHACVQAVARSLKFNSQSSPKK